ncbi:MAG TPA: hypothetical protein VKB72_13665 [Steroidobacteraceae bacterium]|nr:hypothetical protein [Steroidobacteraceae bacterium]
MGDESPVAPLSQGRESPVAPLSQWLQLMLAEIDRKRDEHERARAEAARRASEDDLAAPRSEPGGIENPPLS